MASDRTGCGTNAGHQTHMRRHTRPCEPCRIAHNADQRQRYQIRQLLDLITAECVRAGLLPADWRKPG